MALHSCHSLTDLLMYMTNYINQPFSCTGPLWVVLSAWHVIGVGNTKA